VNDRDTWDRRDIRRRQRRRKGRQRLLALGAILLGIGVGGVVYVEQRKPPPPPPAPPPPVPVTFPEGLRREQMATILEEKTNLSAADYLKATEPNALGATLAGKTDATSLEGFLFPATYEIGTETTVEFLVERQVKAFQKNFASIDLRYATSRKLTPFEVLIIASMIEREVVVSAERRLVAGVIYNRLRRGMRLDIDATVQYAVGEWRPLTGTDLKIDSPYNTRRFPGLPPGPIASPGLLSLQAAARPKQSDYLYYVAREDGTDRHYFAESLDQFNELTRKAQANREKNP
jgi:UPF0755 protein